MNKTCIACGVSNDSFGWFSQSLCSASCAMNCAGGNVRATYSEMRNAARLVQQHNIAIANSRPKL